MSEVNSLCSCGHNYQNYHKFNTDEECTHWERKANESPNVVYCPCKKFTPVQSLSVPQKAVQNQVGQDVGSNQLPIQSDKLMNPTAQSLSDKIRGDLHFSTYMVSGIPVKDIRATNKKILERIGDKVNYLGEIHYKDVEEIIKQEMGKELTE